MIIVDVDLMILIKTDYDGDWQNKIQNIANIHYIEGIIIMVCYEQIIDA